VTWAMPAAVALGPSTATATLPGSRFKSRYEKEVTTRRTPTSCTNLRASRAIRRRSTRYELYSAWGKNTPEMNG